MAMFTGCASHPSNADLMRGHLSPAQVQAQAEGDLQAQLAKDWDKGQELIESGNKNIADGESKVKAAERDLKNGKSQVERGTKELAEGTKLVEASEKGFREAFGDLELPVAK